MFRCKVCQAKDKHIADLKEQIVELRKLIIPDNSPERLPVVHYEADGILSGQQHVLEIPTPQDFAESQRVQEERAERDRILSATF